ncbi:hypothetical protein HMPREF2738_01193 [Clostridiales bacterium KLE1615]|nr:hypothetical protein HMPREF2738_01193 [Clostridiales bacterium KLE1615]
MQRRKVEPLGETVRLACAGHLARSLVPYRESDSPKSKLASSAEPKHQLGRGAEGDQRLDA